MKMFGKLLSAGLLVALTACSSLPTADSDWNQNFDFSKVQTYSFIDRSKLRDMTPLTNDITRNRIENAVDKSMKLKQFAFEADKAKADVLVSYHVTTKDKQDIQTYNVGVNSCWNCWGRGPGMGMGYGTDVRVKNYTEGTLIIDMIDTQSNESVWRGTLSAKISTLKTQQERIDAINYAVTTILAQFPPGSQPEKK